MAKYFATFPEERGGSYLAITPLRSRISEVKVDVSRSRLRTSKSPPDGSLVLIFRRTRRNPVIHALYKWVDNGVERRLVRRGDSKLVARLQSLLNSEEDL